MMYEALTSGAAVGELTLDWVPGSKLKRAGEALISAKRITSFAAREIGMPIPLSHKPLHEAGRCAKSIIEHWKLTG